MVCIKYHKKIRSCKNYSETFINGSKKWWRSVGELEEKENPENSGLT